MKLKKVEVKGFKSFAFKTEIEIKKGITAIVGPNGSGKSNISDAIRWVLGEQSIKNLRGHKMEDVIFAGTSTRKALGYCEVSISFDNRNSTIPLEYEEVEVTRRMFRSGESQYYINKSLCRLKDIKEIFMDTGVGKDGYSIIGQGRIDEILSSRPEDRRSIFEEAAGIVKYKSKKIEAEKKLGKTQENLTRIKDLVHELSKQRKTLEIQARKAKEFKKLYDELKFLEVNLLVRDIKDNKTQLKEIEKNKTILEKELWDLSANERLIEENFSILKKEINDLDDQIEKARTDNMDSLNSLDKAKNELAITNEKERFYQRDIKRLEEERKKINLQTEKLDESKREILKKIQDKNKEYQLLNKDYENKTSKFEDEYDYLNKKEKEIEFRKNNIIDSYNKSSDIKSKLNSIDSFNDSIKNRIEKIRKDIEVSSVNKQENKSSIENERDKKNSVLKLSKELKMQLEHIQSKLDKLNKESSSIYNNINKVSMDRQSKESSLKLLKSMEEGYEGYYRGVKSVLIQSKTNPILREGLIGVVAELIKVEKKYERAIEISLGSNGQNIVTEDETKAKNIIEYLKKNKLGRVTCLPLNIIRGREVQISKEDREKFKILGLGHEIVKYDKRYENILKNLLGRTIIIDDIENAILFAKKTRHQHRIVTLAGEVLNPGGSMTGGSHGGSSVNIINRKNKIEELEYQVTNLNDKHDKLEKENGKILLEINKNKERESEVQAKIKEIEFHIYNIDNNISNYSDEQDRIDNVTKKLKLEIIELNDEKIQYENQYKSLSKYLVEIENKNKREKEEVKKSILILNNEKEKREEQTKLLTELKLDINQIANEMKNLEERKDNIEIDKSKLLKELYENKESINLNKKEIENIKTRKDQLVLSIETLNKESTDMEEKLSRLLEMKKEKMSSFYLEQENLKQSNKSINLKEKNINSLDVKLAKISTELKNTENRLVDEYELNYEEESIDLVEITDIESSISRTRELKASIKKLGNVNLSSIEEYDSVNERLEFILSQKNDLTESKENLNDIVVDMESKMKKQFLLNFKKINNNFVEVFKKLFDGGKAELILEDENDVLNSGIQINAQPPGKKLQSLSLLSGGEKSLTAVALLFSILTLRPAPFCILDEIDAALDESNIGKYTSYLKNFSHDTQFVLITHRKTTMEIADTLYGVTMEEDGISKLISVKLADYVDELAS